MTPPSPENNAVSPEVIRRKLLTSVYTPLFKHLILTELTERMSDARITLKCSFDF